MSKDAGFKVVTHMMPDLPNVGMERDTEQFIVSVKTIDTCTYIHSIVHPITDLNLRLIVIFTGIL